MTFAIWGAVSPDGRLYIYRTCWWVKTLIEIWTKDIINFTGEEVLDDVVVCHSANQHRGEPKTIREQISEAFEGKYEIRLAEKDRIGAKKLIHEYLRWEQKPKINMQGNLKYNNETAQWILRNKGEGAYNDYVALFGNQAEETNLPKLQIFFRSLEGRENKELIDVIPVCMPDENNPEDVAEFSGDDPYDALRAVVRAAHKFYEQSYQRLQEIEKLQRLHALNTAASQTAYYMELERMAAAGELDDDSHYALSHRRVGNRRYRV
jgi:hypothetical protein